mmetsp:Transcript_44175/g.172204  ORF Transcript_44175/g.172204 Transcript_44175/m.172204 type:complete len:97 (-) Transcript_44175:346-636(-)
MFLLYCGCSAFSLCFLPANSKGVARYQGMVHRVGSSKHVCIYKRLTILRGLIDCVEGTIIPRRIFNAKTSSRQSPRVGLEKNLSLRIEVEVGVDGR